MADLYPTKYPGEKTPNVTRYSTQPTEYVTRYPGETTPYKGQPVYPVEPSHFQCQMDQSGYTYDSKNSAEFSLKDANHRDAAESLAGSGGSFTTNKNSLVLHRRLKQHWFSVVTLSFRVKNVNAVKLIFFGENKEVIDKKQVFLHGEL